MRRNLIEMMVGAIAAFALIVPAAPAVALGNPAGSVADTSVDGITQVAKTHTPQTGEQQFKVAVDSSGADDDGIQPYSLDDDSEGQSGSSDGSLTASADLSGLATVGVTWQQQDMDNPDDAPTYQLRYLTDGTWSDWVELPSYDEDAGEMGISPSYYVGNATQAEAKLTPKNGQRITEAKLITVDSGYSVAGSSQTSAYAEQSQNNAAATSHTTQSAVERNSTRSSLQTAAAVTATGTIHTREEWWVAGNPAMDWPPERVANWKGAIVHHTVDRNDYSQAEVPSMINGIYVYHNVTRGWGDIGYQLIVDRFGGIWEGRDEGVANQIVPGSQVVGAQARGFNYDTFGVSMLGSYHLNVAPTDAQIKSVAAAIAWEFDAVGITDPYGTFEYKGTQARITGHGDQSHWSADGANRTTCPGQQVWAKMGAIRDYVKSYLKGVSSLPKVNLADGSYYVNSVAKNSSSVEIAEGSADDGAVTQLHSASGKENQQFAFKKQSDGSYVIANKASDKVLDVANGVASDGAQVRQWAENDSAAQHWFIRDSGAGWYLQSALGNYVLDLAGGSTADGTVVRLYTPNSTSAQKFVLASVSAVIPTGITTKISSVANSAVVLDIASGSTSNGARAQLYSWNNTNAQLYTFKQIGNNLFQIANRNSGKVLEAAGGATINGTAVQQYAANGTAAQHWSVLDYGDGKLMFVNMASAKVLDIPAGNAAVGVQLQLYTRNGSAAQLWKVAESKTVRQQIDDQAVANKDVLPDGTYKVSSLAKNSMVLDVAAGSKNNSANVQLYSSNGTDAQIWTVSHDSVGYVILTNANSGKVLDIASGSSAVGANVQQYASNGSWAQKWIALKNEAFRCLVWVSGSGGWWCWSGSLGVWIPRRCSPPPCNCLTRGGCRAWSSVTRRTADGNCISRSGSRRVRGSLPEPGCGEAACPVHDARERVWRHLNFFQYKAFIHAGVPRVTCPARGRSSGRS
ncbi:N-acetylmuramoyl-L-alanine amidase, partial [Bifidobacterium saguini DSM 23967]